MRTDASQMPRPGEVLGAWRLTRVLGEGSSAWIYGAEHAQTRRRAAVKVLRNEVASEPIALRRWLEETRATAATRHAHVVELLDGEPADARWRYCVLEALEGRSLRHLLDWEGAGSAARSLGIARQLASALAAVHAAGWVHGDVRPDNVLLVHRRGTRDFVKLIDFGFASPPSGDERRHVARDKSDLAGAPEYLSPEQLAGRPYDHRADIYSFGVLLYELVTGERPFGAPSFDDLVVQQLTATPVPPGDHPEIRFAIPASLERLILACLQKDPARRPLSMQKVLDELEVIASEVERLPRRRSRRIALAIAGAGAAVLAAAAYGSEDLTAAVRRVLEGF
jgi:eukaryotic-like serine/threonine-protein kinase